MPEYVTFSADRLREFTARVFESFGVPPADDS